MSQRRGATILGLRKNGEEFAASAAISRLEVDGSRMLTVTLRDVSESRRDEVEHQVLAEVGQILIAAGADVERSFGAVVDVLIRRDVADWCIVHLIGTGDAPLLRFGRPTPELAEACAALTRFVPEPELTPQLARILATRTPLLRPTSRPRFSPRAPGGPSTDV
jgi:hypothetical protein